tara:strand:- start:2431 stop:2850 length:420 start_codon:yes stop_codon:yes gene_type:complete
MHDNLEDNVEVREFLNSQNSSVEIIARAYKVRDDVLYGKNYVFDKNKHLEKLGYTEEKTKSYVMNLFRSTIFKKVNNFISNPSKVVINLEDEYNMFMASPEIVNFVSFRKNRFNILNNIDDNFEFYNSMTKEELTYIGW